MAGYGTSRFNPARGRTGALVGGAGFNAGAAGKKHYGGGRPSPNQGKTRDIAGYNERDARAEAKKNAVLRRAQGGI